MIGKRPCVYNYDFYPGAHHALYITPPLERPSEPDSLMTSLTSLAKRIFKPKDVEIKPKNVEARVFDYAEDRKLTAFESNDQTNIIVIATMDNINDLILLIPDAQSTQIRECDEYTRYEYLYLELGLEQNSPAALS